MGGLGYAVSVSQGADPHRLALPSIVRSGSAAVACNGLGGLTTRGMPKPSGLGGDRQPSRAGIRTGSSGNEGKGEVWRALDRQSVRGKGPSADHRRAFLLAAHPG